VRGLFGGPPVTVTDARRRRREMLLFLSFVAAASIVPFVMLGGVFAYVALAACSVLAMYVLLLVRAQKIADERYEKVRYLHAADSYDGYEYEYDDEYEYQPALQYSVT
jgi:hypothetical protein